MTENQYRWNDTEVQKDLHAFLEQHFKNLRENPTPRNDEYLVKFIEQADFLAQGGVWDGYKVYEILRNTGGWIYANELYVKYHAYFEDYVKPDDSILLPDLFLDAADELGAMPELSPEIIGGVLRRGDRMLISGGSKTSKSFLALELAVAVALGRDWLDTYSCKQGRVLYVNGEIKRPNCDRRLAAILERLKINREDLRGKMSILPLRDREVTVNQLPEQIRKKGGYDLIILDPIYTLGDVSDENNAAAVRKFLREIGNLASETGAAVICIHHHSKGTQGGKKAIDRASGSGVFGRWFDCILDLSTLNVPQGVAEQSKTPDNTPMRLEFDLRDFAPPKPLSVWWHYPIHIPDISGELEGCLVDGDQRANLKQYADGQSAEQRRGNQDAELKRAIDTIKADGREPTVAAVAAEVGKSGRTVRNWLNESEQVTLDGKVVKLENRK